MIPFSVHIAPSRRLQAAFIGLHTGSMWAAWHYFHGTARYALSAVFAAGLVYTVVRHSRFVPQIVRIDVRPDGKVLIFTDRQPQAQAAEILSGSLNHPLLHILGWRLTESGTILRHSIFPWQADQNARRRLSVWLRFAQKNGT